MPSAGILREAWLWYLKPKKFEFYKNRTIYDLIGIKLYKKYLPTTGDLARRRKGIKQLDIEANGRRQSLYKYELKTRNHEWRHLLGVVAFVLLTLLVGPSPAILSWTLLFILNLYINVYPIFLQRFNRIRIIRVLKAAGLESPYERK